MKLHQLAFIVLLLPVKAIAMTSDPVDFVRTTTERVLIELDNSPGIKLDPGRLRALVESSVLSSIDFARLSRLVLGKHWRSASPAQRASFTEGFSRLLVTTYSISLAEYAGQQIEYSLLNGIAGGRRATVRTKLTQPGGSAVVVDYRLYLSGDHWKIYDVSIEGVSLAVNYRSNFSRQIQNHGLDGLIKQLVIRRQ